MGIREGRLRSFIFFKENRRSEVSPFLNLAQFEIYDNELSTTGTSDMEGQSRTWFWNERIEEEREMVMLGNWS